MSFTQDELQSFNSILEQRLSFHRRELERAFDQRMNVLKREFEQRLAVTQQEIIRTFTQKLSPLQLQLNAIVAERNDVDRAYAAQSLSQEIVQKQNQLEQTIEQTLANHLSAIEQLVSTHYASLPLGDASSDFGSIEVQTEIPWEDLVDGVGKALDERLASLNASTQSAIKSLEHFISARLHNLHVEFERVQVESNNGNGNISNMQDVFKSIEQLERIIESMQMAMTANHALLSNRLFHHQQLPLERAHVNSAVPASHANSINGKNGHPPHLKEHHKE